MSFKLRIPNSLWVKLGPEADIRFVFNPVCFKPTNVGPPPPQPEDDHLMQQYDDVSHLEDDNQS